MLVRVVLDRLRRDEERRRCFLVRRSLRDERGHPTFVPRQLGDRVASQRPPPRTELAPRLLRPRRGSKTLESATGFDFEDGSLADGAITWSIDGAPTGHGAVVVNASALRLGGHLASVRVVGSAGAATTTAAGFSVGTTGSSSGGSSSSSTNQPGSGSTPIVTPPPSQFPPPTPARTLQALGGASATPVRSSSSRWPTRESSTSACEFGLRTCRARRASS